MKTGLEIFEMIYNNTLGEDNCIKYKDKNNIESYLLRDGTKEFNNTELIDKLLNAEYTFKVENQEKVLKEIAENNKQERIKQLEAELARLKGE